MLKKITGIKNSGLVFQDFCRTSQVHGFKKCNLIYGWNGSGKTTLTRLFSLITSNQNHDAEFQVEYKKNENGQDNQELTIQQGQHLPFSIKVFNQDYIEQNIDVKYSTAKAISMLLGNENVELVKKN